MLQRLKPTPGQQVHWLINVANYQAVWFMLVMGRNSLAWLAILLVLAHLGLSGRRKGDLLLLVLFGISGMALDGILKAVGLFGFADDGFPIPVWLIVLWLSLATLPGHALSWLWGRPFLCSVFGGLAGPLAYLAGSRLGAAELLWPTGAAMLVLALVWGGFWPLAMHLTGKVYGMTGGR